MNCPLCGAPLENGAAFCGSCGAKVEQPAYEQPQAPGYEQSSQTYGQPIQGGYEQPQPQYAPPPQYAPAGPAPGPNATPYLVWSILVTLFCCIPAGVVGIVYAAKIDGLKNKGDLAGAEEAARKSKLWSIIGAVVTVVLMVLYIVLIVAGIASMDIMDEFMYY